MIICLITLAALIVSGVWCFRAMKTDNDFWLVALFLFAGSVAAVGVCVTSVIGTQVTTDVNYQNKLEEKMMLEYRLEKGDTIPGNELLYTQIVEFNNDLRNTKKWANSLWTNWFNNQKIAEMDYIVISDMHSKEKG